jgi:hypothetical protein
LASQLALDTAQQQGAMPNDNPNFDPFIGQDPTGMVLPDRGSIQPQQQSFQVSGGGQMPQAQPYQMQPQPQGSVPQNNFSDFFNLTGSAPNSPNSEQGVDPNMFLRLSEGYNRGGMLGALGMLLTDYK